MEYSYPYRHPGLNYVYPQVPTQLGFAMHSGAMNPVTTGITATSNQSTQSVGISVNINPLKGSPVSAKLVLHVLMTINGHYLEWHDLVYLL